MRRPLKRAFEKTHAIVPDPFPSRARLAAAQSFSARAENQAGQSVTDSGDVTRTQHKYMSTAECAGFDSMREALWSAAVAAALERFKAVPRHRTPKPSAPFRERPAVIMPFLQSKE